MKKFNIFRYLKQFSLLIFLLAVVGSVAIFLYGKSQQRYIATVVIQYTNTGAKEGLTPDGSPLDVTEIYSSTVIDRALRELESSANIDSVRSNCYVEEVIPEDQQKLNEALIEKGQESTYIPDTYKVFFVADSDKDEDYAWNILDSIIKNYCEFYTEKYVEEQLQSNDSLAMLQGEYDFIESAQILENDVSQMLDYLLTQRANWPNFRSVETGYTYGDLYNIYSYLYSYDIPNLYSLILGTAETKDIEVLKNRLTRDSEDLQLSIDQCQQQANHLKLLIDNYSGRNKEMMDYHYHNSNSQDGGTEYILKDVEYDKDNHDKETTYDGLIQEYVNLNINYIEGKLPADDRTYDSAKEFNDGTIQMGLADIASAMAAKLLGSKVDSNGVLIDSTEDDANAPFVAVGFKAKRSSGKYEFDWLYRVKFSKPNETYQTKGDSINFSTPTIEGTIYARNKPLTNGDHAWRAKCVEGETAVAAAAVSGWFESVYEPTFTP